MEPELVLALCMKLKGMEPELILAPYGSLARAIPFEAFGIFH